jgi:hypothetical protein
MASESDTDSGSGSARGEWKSLTSLIACVCVALALTACGSSSDDGSPATGTPTDTPAPAQDQAATQVCSARDDIQKQVQTLTSLNADTATKANVTSALTAIQADLQKIVAAQPDLTSERKQQVQDATTAFAGELKDIVRQAIAGLATTDAQTQATKAAESLESAVKTSLEPIDC